MLDVQDRFYPAQYTFFVFCAGILGSYLLYRENKWLGFIFALCSFGFLKTYLLQHTPLEYLFKTALFGSAIFISYYFSKQLKLKEDILKWFLIPAYFNIALIFIQRFDHNFLSFMPVGQITGFLGNRGITACYLTMATPLFIRYFKQGIPFLLLSLLFSSILALTISLIIILCYLWLENNKLKRQALLIFIIVLIGIIIGFKGKIINSLHIRAAESIGTLDGIKHNPILGWGLGSYEPVMMNVAQDNKLEYFGIKISAKDRILGHPHNEILLGWWNFGILFPILIIYLIRDFLRRYTQEKIIPFLILIAAGICSMFYFLSPPMWFLMMLSLGIYENEEVKQCQNIR